MSENVIPVFSEKSFINISAASLSARPASYTNTVYSSFVNVKSIVQSIPLKSALVTDTSGKFP